MKKNISRKLLRSILLRIICGGVLWSSWYWDISLPWIEWWLLLPLYLLMREVLCRMDLPGSIPTREVHRELVEQDKRAWTISLVYHMLLINRMYIFPVLLTIYLTYLVIAQTGIFWLDYSILFLALEEQLLLILTIISWIAMVIQEDKDDRYIGMSMSRSGLYMYIVLGMVLGVLWWYIVLQQTLSLWWLGIVIANIAGLLIFFVWLLLVDEE